MAQTNFAALTDEEKTIWSMDFWRKARNESFSAKFTGTSESSLIQRITELKKSEKGARAVITLVNDLEGDGRAGDRQLEGNEEALTSEEQVIQIDQIRHANRNKGRMSDQRSIVNFREQSRDKLAYWASDRVDQMHFLSLAGVGFNYHTNGAPRVGSDLPLLEFAADVRAPTAGRYFVVEGGTDRDGVLTPNGDQANITAAGGVLRWDILVDLKAYAEAHYIRPIRMNNGISFYHVFVTPQAFRDLKKDPDYLANVRNAGVRGQSNELFKGTDTIMVDGLAISSFRHVYNTTGAASGSKWGGGTVDGCRLAFCGAQALGYADIGNSEWDEERFDYKNQNGISIAKILGLLKPQFEGKLMGGMPSGTIEDFGVISVDIAAAA
jgi:N4-gp56 family major capsid protein